MWNLYTETKRVRVSNSAAAAQTTITSSAVDMQGYDAVQFVALLNTVTAGAVMTLAAQDCATSGGSYNAISGASVAVTDVGGATSNKMISLDVVIPQQRFVEATLTRGTANAAVDGIVAILYRAKEKPTTPDSSEAGGGVFVAAS